jgi:glycosyltransferase involved in cell wall biosynthesis
MHVAYALDSLVGGGAQRQAVELGRALVRRGCRVSLTVYRNFDFYAADAEAGGVEVVRLPKRVRLDPGLPLRIRRWLRQARPDVVHAFLLPPSVWTFAATRLLRRPERPPLVAAARSAISRLSAGDRWLHRVVYGRCDAVTANSHESARDLEALLGASAPTVRFLPNGIDLERWEVRARKPCPLALEPEAFHLAVVGRIGRDKNQELMVEALARLAPEERRGWRVWLVGALDIEPDVVERVRRRIGELGLAETVRLPGPTRDVAALLPRVNALVMPSLSEGFPNAVLEAMAAARPIVATAVGEIPHMLEDGRSGILCPAVSAGALAAGLRRLAGLSEARRADLGAEARRDCVERYGMDAVAATHLAFYEALVANPAVAASLAPRQSSR